MSRERGSSGGVAGGLEDELNRVHLGTIASLDDENAVRATDRLSSGVRIIMACGRSRWSLRRNRRPQLAFR
jgi:hypothetical protein